MWPGWPGSAAGGTVNRRGGAPWWAVAWLQLLRFCVVLAVIAQVIRVEALDVVVTDRGRVEPGRAVLQRKTQPDQLHLDLVDRLGPEVADIEQVCLAASDELTHGVDALTLEAVVRADGEVELLDRH